MSQAQGPEKVLRILVADDEPAIREAYGQVFGETDVRAELEAIQDLRARLFSRPAPATAPRRPTFEAHICCSAIEVVAAATTAIATGTPYSVVFLDMRMPPGEDGGWAAARIRELDPDIEIVICTAYSDVDPAHLGGQVPPQEKISFLQNPSTRTKCARWPSRCTASGAPSATSRVWPTLMRSPDCRTASTPCGA